MSEFIKLINAINSRHVYIQTHDFPDADATASAYGLKVLLDKYGYDATICYSGYIDRCSTSRMMESCNIKMVNMMDIKGQFTDDCIIYVDSQTGNSNISALQGENVISIDHHRAYEAKDSRYRFTDIRDNYGACSTIIAKYYFDNNVDMPKDVATALLFGIKVDTSHMTRGVTKEDLDVFYRLSMMCDTAKIDDLSSNSFKLEDIALYSKTISNIEVNNGAAFANAGDNCPEVVIAAVSDFMISIEDIMFSVVYSVRKTGIKMSVRSKNRHADAGAMLFNVLKGIGTGGGHSVMAGGFVPFVCGGKTAEELISIIEARFIAELGMTQKEIYNDVV